MTPSPPIRTEGLTESARRALEYLARRFRGDFTGRMEVECREGGVRRLEEHRSLGSVELAEADGEGAA